MIPVVCPAYLPNVQYFQWLLKQEKVYFSSSDHYQKQTFRNRTAIYGANGKLNLTLPIAHHSNTHVHDIDVVISDTIPWQQQHWKSFCAAYRSAPFFEFYEDAFYPFYHRPQTSLFEFNINLIEEILTLLEIDWEYHCVPFEQEKHKRMEALILAKNQKTPSFPAYTQVFSNKYGFIPNLSVVDVLFNLGPETEAYLRNNPS